MLVGKNKNEIKVFTDEYIKEQNMNSLLESKKKVLKIKKIKKQITNS